MELRLNNDTKLTKIVDPVTDSNCYVLLREGRCAVIDPNNFEALDRLLQKCNTDSLLVLLTHEHCDHIGGLNKLRENYRTVVVASGLCSLGMQNAKENMSRMMETFLYFKSGQTKMVKYDPFTCLAADVQFGDEMWVPFGGSAFRMTSLPGHTHGSSMIAYEGVLFCGDYLLPGEKVVTRLPGGDDEEYEKFARPWLRSIPDGTWIYPGHGEAFMMDAEVRRFHDL
jgi:glyoxylase-like metal-dependent hydrolase (beta-lactamase superfamily II)